MQYDTSAKNVCTAKLQYNKIMCVDTSKRVALTHQHMLHLHIKKSTTTTTTQELRHKYRRERYGTNTDTRVTEQIQTQELRNKYRRKRYGTNTDTRASVPFFGESKRFAEWGHRKHAGVS